MIERRLNSLTLEIIQGNITDQPDCDAIVNAANAQLQSGGGVAGAIHNVGDPELTEETRSMAPISPGEAVISSAPNFPNIITQRLCAFFMVILPAYTCRYGSIFVHVRVILYTVLPFCEVLPGDQHGRGEVSIKIKFRRNRKQEIIWKAVKNLSDSLDNVELVRFVLFGEEDYKIFEEMSDEILE